MGLRAVLRGGIGGPLALMLPDLYRFKAFAARVLLKIAMCQD